MITANPNATKRKSGGKIDFVQAKVEQSYAAINQEAESLLSPADKIVFIPAEDFEYKVPLEDFKKTLHANAK